METDIDGGMASYYGNELAGNRTANGERFDPGQLTAAHRTLPFGSMVRVTNMSNGDSVIVRINDRGPFARGRVIDVRSAAARESGMTRRGRREEAREGEGCDMTEKNGGGSVTKKNK